MLDLALYRARIRGFRDGHGHLQKRGRDPFRKRRLSRSLAGELLCCLLLGMVWMAVACSCLQMQQKQTGLFVPKQATRCKVSGTYRVGGGGKIPLWHCMESKLTERWFEQTTCCESTHWPECTQMGSLTVDRCGDDKRGAKREEVFVGRQVKIKLNT